MRDDEIETLIAFLQRIQEDQYLSLKGLARRLGFSAGHLSMIYSGKRRPGMRFVRAVFRHFPEIRAHLSPLSPPEDDD
ncbi:MAG: helix-turn-helix domain-containing protein [Anaerolineales bacterium]